MMHLIMYNWLLLLFVCACVDVVHPQGTGSGTDGNLRLCIVERGKHKLSAKYCPILDRGKSGIECVIGVDRLDCLRRIHKGTVDFGAFTPEDLIAAQWDNIEVLVTNELRNKHRAFARNVVAVINNRILSRRPALSGAVDVADVLRNTTLCHPAVDVDDLKPLSDTIIQYLESLVTLEQCDPSLSLTENRLSATARLFNRACMAGPWVPDSQRDLELKRKYNSLCAACASRCDKEDPYWGSAGALLCLAEGAGDVTWADLDDVRHYFKTNSATAQQISLLCRDGSAQALNASEPCVWVRQPWNVIIAKRKAAEAVSLVTARLTNGSVIAGREWPGALAQLLSVHAPLPPPLEPALPPQDYLRSATGFVEAYSQHGCNPPRHITLCTTSNLALNKCTWLAEAGAVYGVSPPLQCARRETIRDCMAAVRAGEVDAVVAGGDWLVSARREYSLVPVLHEATNFIESLTTVSAYVRKNSTINHMADLRGKRAAFPSFDGVAWHSVINYLTNNTKETCKNVAENFFSSVCAPGMETHNVSQKTIQQYTQTCYKEGDTVLSGEDQALRSLVEGKSDVAFISRMTYNLYRAKHFKESWAKDLIELDNVCPEESKSYCLVGWSSIGHIFASTNITQMKRHEMINILTKLDQLFGDHAHKDMFSMYGEYNHQLDVLFHNNTRMLITDEYLYERRPFMDIPLNLERNLNASNICQYSDFVVSPSYGTKVAPTTLFVWSLVFSVILLV